MTLLLDPRSLPKKTEKPQSPRGLFLLLAALLIGVTILVVSQIHVTGGNKNTNTNRTNSATNVNRVVLTNEPLDVVVPKIIEHIKSTLDKNDFAVFAAPSSRSVKPGGSVSYKVQVVRGSSMKDDISLDTIGLPDNVTATWKPKVAAGDTSESLLTLDVSKQAALGKINFTITAKAAAGQRTDSPTLTISDLAASDIVANNVHAMSQGTKWQATITWKTDAPANSWIEYTAGADFVAANQEYAFTANDSANEAAHSVTLSFLDPDVVYHFRVRSVDKLNNIVQSDDETFVTQ